MTKTNPTRKSVASNAQTIATLALALAFVFGCSEKCGGAKYDPEKQFCVSGKEVQNMGKCGDDYYIPQIKFCFENKIYDKCSHIGYDESSYDCPDCAEYNPATHFCWCGPSSCEPEELCGGKEYDQCESCVDGKVQEDQRACTQD